MVKELDELLRSTAYLMNQLTRKYAVEQGISIPRFWVLFNVSKCPGITMGELQNKMYLAPSSISGLVDSLVEDGFLLRDKDPADRRVVKLIITQEGEELLEKVLNYRYERLNEAFGSARQEDIALLKRVLDILVQSLQQQLHRACMHQSCEGEKTYGFEQKKN